METGKIKCADQELIVRAQSGDQRAFEALVRRHYQRAYALAFFWIGNRETALDISQEAFVRIYRNIHRFDAEKSLVAWLYVIVKNLCKNDLTRRRRRWLVFSDFFGREGRTAENRENDWPAGGEETPSLENDERREMLWRALHQLPEPDREIIVLKDLQEFSYKEISEMLEIPPGTVMSRLYYARKKLTNLLKMKDM